MTTDEKITIGSLELCNLPKLGIQDLQVRIDTGAKTSSLHVDNLVRFKKRGKPWVRFDLHPELYRLDEVVACETPLIDIRRIKSSNGKSEQRYIIRTDFQIGQKTWPIEISLSNRTDMTYLMLLGREAMKNQVLVDPSKNYTVNEETDIDICN